MNGDTPQTPDSGNVPQKLDDAPTSSATTPIVADPAAQSDVAPQVAPIAAPEQPVVPAPEAPSEPVGQAAFSQPEQDTSFAPQDDEQSFGFTPEPSQPPVADVTWTASEFIAHEKTSMWYITLAGVTLVVVLAIYFLVHDFVAIAALIAVAIIFGFLAAHKPRVLTYSITPAGLSIDRKTYSFSDFKSYGVINEGAFSNITFMPLKRFMPTLSIYYPPEQESAIVDALSNYLPFAPVTHDLVDRLMHRIRL